MTYQAVETAVWYPDSPIFRLRACGLPRLLRVCLTARD